MAARPWSKRFAEPWAGGFRRSVSHRLPFFVAGLCSVLWASVACDDGDGTAPATQDGTAAQDTNPTPPNDGAAAPEEIWRASFGEDRYLVVAADEKLVVAASAPQYPQINDGERFVAALDPANGAELWRLDLECAPFQPVLTTRAVVFACQDGLVRALSRGDGNVIWEADTGSAPFLAVPAGDLLLLGDGDPDEHYWLPGVDGVRWVEGTVVALDASSGQEAWRVETGLELVDVRVLDGVAYLWASGRTGSEPGVLLAVDAQTGAERWRVEGVDEMGTNFVDRQTAFVPGSLSLRAIDAQSGAELWATGEGYRSPFRVGEIVVVNAGYGSAALKGLAAGSGEMVWEQPYCDCGYWPQAFDGGVLVSGAGVGLLNPVTGEFEWSLSLDDGATYPAAVAAERIYAASGGILAAFE